MEGAGVAGGAEAEGGEGEGGGAEELGSAEGEAGGEDLDGEDGARVSYDGRGEGEVEGGGVVEGFGGFLEGGMDPGNGEWGELGLLAEVDREESDYERGFS